MNTHDVLMYGHRWVHLHLDGLTDEQWLEPNVCGVWSTKDIIAHLTSFECLLIDVFSSCIRPTQTPVLEAFTHTDGDSFNAVQVGMRQAKSPVEVLKEYDDAYAEGMKLLAQIDEKTLHTPGTLPWYGNEYSIQDLIVYQYYGHKREHCAQIAVYRDRLKTR